LNLRAATVPNEPSETSAAADGGSRLLAYLRLLRLPNVFTALADVLMGFLLVRGGVSGESWPLLALLLGASALLYTAGMVLNDVHDVEQDRRERPFRPIPSGQISLAWARGLGHGMLGGGVLLGWAASVLAGDPRCGLVASLLAALVVLYDRVLKPTLLGPVAMGGCRFANVLLGMSAAVSAWRAAHYLVAGGVAAYIAGVTWFARREAHIGQRLQLAAALGVMLAGLAMLACYPLLLSPDDLAPLLRAEPYRWVVLWVVLAPLMTWRSAWAIVDPQPEQIQLAVRQSLGSLIVIDAIVVFAVLGAGWAIVVLFLLLPMTALGQYVYST
jgi:4-hydroxybenzoate polyprenyltransferase